MIIVDDDLVSGNLADVLENLCMEPRSMVYMNNTVDNRKTFYCPGFIHPIKRDSEIMSDLFHTFLPLITLGLNKYNLKIAGSDSIGRQRLVFQPATNREVDYIHDEEHVDLIRMHTVFIYYVNDSGGGTYIYDRTKETPSNHTLLKFVDHKKGRVVIFNGKYYHAGAQSTNSTRIVLNANIFNANLSDHSSVG